MLIIEQVKIIREIIETHFNLDISKKSRKRELIDAKKIYSLMCRKHTSAIFKTIGEEINQDHSTSLYQVSSGQNLLEYDRDFRLKYDAIDVQIPLFDTKLHKTPLQSLQNRLKTISEEILKIKTEIERRKTEELLNKKLL